MVIAGGGVLAAALLGIGGWYVAHTKATEAQLSRAIADYEARNQLVDVTFSVTPPPNTPKEQVLYLSGSVPALGNWDAAGVAMTRSDDGKYIATVAGLQNTGEYKFKITRGTWGTVETTKSGETIADRTFIASKDAKVDVTVEEWNDKGQAVPGRVTMTGNIIVHRNALKSDILGNARTVVVYLPPDYEKNKEQRYPVLYLQDGQNLFDEATSYQGIEWQLDEAAQRLIAQGRIRPAIIVGIYNSEQRTSEFAPPYAAALAKDAKPPTPRGDDYAKMLVQEARPFIDEAYRTAPGRENTIIGGGSMGALIALHAAKLHNDVFGHVIALSPWLRAGDNVLVDQIIGDGAWLKNTKLYLDMGTNAGHNYPGGADKAIADAEAFAAAAEKAGVSQGETFTYREIEGGTHNETAWQATAEQVLLAALGLPIAPTSSPAPPAPPAPPTTQGIARSP